MRASGNLAGVEFIAPPFHAVSDEARTIWNEIITESGYFFTKDSMRFFGSKVHWQTLTPIDGGFMFVTSEQDKSYYGVTAWDGERRYTVRKWTLENGVGRDEFGEFETLKQATKEMKARAK